MDRQLLSSWLVIGIPIALLVAFVVYPVLTTLGIGILDLTASELPTVLSSSVDTLVFTIAQATLSTILVVLVGLPGAFLLARLRFKGKPFVRAALVVPFVLPPIVVVVGFLQVFGAYGILDSTFMALLGTTNSVLNLANGIVGILLAHTFYNIPLVILMVSAALERLNPEIEESAEILGASTAQKFRHIILPHVWKALLAASLLTFLFCFMSFPIVLSLGEGRILTLEVNIWYAFRRGDLGETSLLAIIQILITLALAFSYVQLTKSDDHGVGETGSIKTIPLGDLSPFSGVLVALYFLLLAFLVAGPIIAIIRAAFFHPISGVYTLDGFAVLIRPGTGGGLTPLINTLLYGTLATILAVILGIPLAYALRSRAGGLRTIASTLTLLPLGVSALTVAYGLMIAIAVPLGLTTNPWALIVIAQTIIGLPFTTRAIEVALSKVNPAIFEQAEILGANRLQRLFFVELPLLAPGILAGGVFAFAMAIGEMSATYFIALEQNTTLAVVIYTFLSRKNSVAAGAAALVLVSICFIAFVLIEKLSGTDAGVGL